VRVVRRRAEDRHGAVASDAARGSGTPRERRRHVARGSPGVPSQGLDQAEPVMYLSWTRRIPALVTHRITWPQGPLAAAVSEAPGRLKWICR